MKRELTRVSVVNEVMGRMMKDARKARGLTQDEAASHLRLSQSRLSVYENGGTIPFERVVKMCRLYELDIRLVAKTIEAIAE